MSIDLGEFELIQRFTDAFVRAGGALANERVVLGPGDDCAVLGGGGPLAITADVVVEDVHFRRSWFTWEELGHKALAVNLSDLAAMGARPVAFTCSLALPANVSAEDLDALAKGMGRLASRYDTALAGGNFTRAGELSVNITAIGALESEPLRRGSALPGDRVFLVGELGVAAAELALLTKGAAVPDGPSVLKTPEPLVEAGLVATRFARCAIDVSDGLIQDLDHVASASGVRIDISPYRLPRSRRFVELSAGRSDDEQLQLLLAGGEDYALVIIAPPERLSQLADHVGGVEIGRVSEGEGVHVAGHEGRQWGGHDHFAG